MPKALHYACFFGHLEVVKILITNGAGLNIQVSAAMQILEFCLTRCVLFMLVFVFVFVLFVFIFVVVLFVFLFFVCLFGCFQKSVHIHFYLLVVVVIS